MQHFSLIDAGFDVFFRARLDQIFLREVAIVDFLAVLSARPSALLLAVIKEIQRCMVNPIV
jgi:hypothetical protein